MFFWACALRWTGCLPGRKFALGTSCEPLGTPRAATRAGHSTAALPSPPPHGTTAHCSGRDGVLTVVVQKCSSDPCVLPPLLLQPSQPPIIGSFLFSFLPRRSVSLPVASRSSFLMLVLLLPALVHFQRCRTTHPSTGSSRFWFCAVRGEKGKGSPGGAGLQQAGEPTEQRPSVAAPKGQMGATQHLWLLSGCVTILDVPSYRLHLFWRLGACSDGQSRHRCCQSLPQPGLKERQNGELVAALGEGREQPWHIDRSADKQSSRV